MYGDARKEKMHEEKEMPWRQISVCGPKACLKRTQQDPKKREDVGQAYWLMVIGVVVSHPLSMREALGSIPTWSITKETHGKDEKVGRIQVHT